MNQEKLATPSFKQKAENIDKALKTFPSSAQEIVTNEIETSKSSYAPDQLPLKVGDQAPDFSLKNAVGKTVSLYELLKESRVVLTFYRGTWCPYCNLELSQYQEVVFRLKSIGSQMVAISPQNPDESLNMQEKNNLTFEVLSDPGNKVARQYTNITKKSDQYAQLVSGNGKSFEDYYDSRTNEIPIPAVYIIEQDGKVVFARSEGGDYRKRVEPKEVLDALTKK